MVKAEKWIWLDEERYPEYQTTIYTSIEKKEAGNYNVAEFVKEYFFDCEVAEAEPLPSVMS